MVQVFKYLILTCFANYQKNEITVILFFYFNSFKSPQNFDQNPINQATKQTKYPN